MSSTDQLAPDDRRIGAAVGVQDSRQDKIVAICNYTALGLFAAAVLYPLTYVLSASLSDPSNVVSGEVWLWPVGFSLDAYKAIFDYEAIVTGFGNSVVYAIGGSLLATALTLLAAFPLSRKGLPGKGIIMALFVFTMMFNGGLIPSYLVVEQLGLLNTRWAMIVPGALAVWNVIITRTYFQVSIPDELHEAATMDGCSDFGFFWRIVLPLSKPIIAVNMLFYAVGQWNSWFNALIYLTNEHLFPLQVLLRQILIQGNIDASGIQDASELLRRRELQQQLKFSLIVIAAIPPLLIYPFVQKHFVKGAMVGSLKG
jgi:putative aldouronate transport system permease protein